MEHDSTNKRQQLSVRIANATTDAEKEALRLWIEKLLAIRESSLPTRQKAKSALAATQESKVVIPTVKVIARELKRLAWDDRGLKGRSFIGVSAGALAVFGGQGAGIAALGTAVGVPLWVVLGTGAVVVAGLYEDLFGEKPPTTTYTVVDAEKSDNDDDSAA